jgi:acyl-CoA thioester hydrolase
MNKESITKITVRYSETDQMGVVYYANYLVWFEVARTDFFKNAGVDYNLLEKDRKIYLPVAESYCRYKSPVKYDDTVSVVTTLTKLEKIRITFEYEIVHENRVKAVGKTKHAFVDKIGKPIPVPEDIRELLSKHM